MRGCLVVRVKRRLGMGSVVVMDLRGPGWLGNGWGVLRVGMGRVLIVKNGIRGEEWVWKIGSFFWISRRRG